MQKPNYQNWPCYSDEEINAVSSVLKSGKVNYWTGQEGRLFEREFAEFCDAEHAVALSNGTLALELALRALNIGDGDEVIVTPRTFLASVSAIVIVGAIPVFADVDLLSQNISPETVNKVLTKRSRAIIAVHLAGWPCDMDGLMELAEENNLFVIEDCAQAHGALYKGKSVGALGHVAAWSFCQDKIMTTGGEGGMLSTNDPVIWDRVWSYKDHGKSWNAVYPKDLPVTPGFRWVHESFGTNARMTEQQAAIGRIQICKIAEWHDSRKRNADAIHSVCKEFPQLLSTPRPPSSVEHAWYKCYTFVRPDVLKQGWSRDHIMERILSLGVPCFSGSCSEVYLEKAFDKSGWRPRKRLSVAKELGETSLMFLVHPTLTESDMNKICSVIKQVMSEASQV